jgi:hypothetical protein
MARNLISIDKEIEKIVQEKKEELLERLRRATPVDTGRARDSWRIDEEGIVNDVPYINELNQGSSTQAPKYFIESTVLSTSDISLNGIIASSTR